MAQYIQTMIDGNDDHVAAPSKRLAILAGDSVAGSSRIVAAMHPDHDGPFPTVYAWRPDIQIETVFAGVAHLVIQQKAHPVGRPRWALRTRRPVGKSIPDP